MRTSTIPSLASLRCAVLALVCALVCALAAPALANEHEVVFAINKTQLHIRPGEAAPVVGHADEGEELEVLGDQGRWLKVRNGKQIGWLTRTEVSPTKPAEPRLRGERSGFSGKPVTDAVKVTVVIDKVRGFDDPRTKAKNTLDLARGDVVTVIGRGHGGWVLVEQEDRGVGWIPASTVSDAGKFAADPRQAPVEAKGSAEAKSPAKAGAAEPMVVVVKPAAPPAAGKRMRAMMLATAGAQTFQMQQTGEGDPKAIATGMIATLDARAQMRVRRAIWAGVGASAEIGTADMTYYGAAEQSQPMSTKELVVDAYAEVGWGNRRYIAARGGVHYGTISVESERNEPMLLGERIGGPTVGLAGATPLGRHLSFSAAIDVMPVGSQQLSRLPPGTLQATAVRAGWARATLAMPLPLHLLAAVSYRFGMLSAQLADDSAMPKTATRADQSHVITAGVGVTW